MNDATDQTEQDTEAMLTDLEARVLGSLMEKQMTTPDQYPLTLNALVSACNQLKAQLAVHNTISEKLAAYFTRHLLAA